jgi:hypothetical protein
MKILKTISFWYFIGCSVYMILPIRRVFIWFKDCCKKFTAVQSFKSQPISYNQENYDSINPMTKSEGRVRALDDLRNLLVANLAEV